MNKAPRKRAAALLRERRRRQQQGKPEPSAYDIELRRLRNERYRSKQHQQPDSRDERQAA